MRVLTVIVSLLFVASAAIADGDNASESEVFFFCNQGGESNDAIAGEAFTSEKTAEVSNVGIRKSGEDDFNSPVLLEGFRISPTQLIVKGWARGADESLTFVHLHVEGNLREGDVSGRFQIGDRTESITRENCTFSYRE